jgi:hypothetical protein
MCSHDVAPYFLWSTPTKGRIEVSFELIDVKCRVKAKEFMWLRERVYVAGAIPKSIGNAKCNSKIIPKPIGNR